MKSQVCFVIVVALLQVIQGCPPIDLPEFTSMNCTWIKPSVKQCRFECVGEGDLIGSPVITCPKNADQWNDNIPICYPDFTNCGKGKGKKCPKLTKSYLGKFQVHRSGLSKEAKLAVKNLRKAFKSAKLSRGVKKRRCYTWMCGVHCPFIPKKVNQSVVKLCNKCRRDVLKCNKHGSVFG